MPVSKIPAALFLLLFAACSPDILPLAGQWTAQLNLDEDECALNLDTSQPAPFTLGAVTEEALTIDIGLEALMECRLADSQFNCTPITRTIDLNEDGIDAFLTRSHVLAGDFEDEENGNMTSTIEYTCEGTQCEDASNTAGVAVPCTTTVSGRIRYGM